MCEGYYASEGDDASGLDEFLCEYVDGTMDPVVRTVFEEYLRQNPHLVEHVECLRQTRSVLCRYGCRMRAPAALQERLRARLAQESVSGAPHMPTLALSLQWVAGICSVLLLAVGLLSSTSTADGSPDLMTTGNSDAHLDLVDPLPNGPNHGGITAASLAGAPFLARRTPLNALSVREPSHSDSSLSAIVPARAGFQSIRIP